MYKYYAQCRFKYALCAFDMLKTGFEMQRSGLKMKRSGLILPYVAQIYGKLIQNSPVYLNYMPFCFKYGLCDLHTRHI
jgi:hypothetical protein